jgi:hypothetical protein
MQDCQLYMLHHIMQEMCTHVQNKQAKKQTNALYANHRAPYELNNHRNYKE